MRTGPFSDPVVISLINRYFVPVHLDNVTGAGIRYDMPPGHEDAYIILETPELLRGPQIEFKVLGRIDGLRGPEAALETHVLEPAHITLELQTFLTDHPELYHPWPELEQLEERTDPEGRLRRAELLLDEGRVDEAAAILADLEPERDDLRILAARAARLHGEWAAAASTIEAAASSPARDIERIRIAWAQGDMDRAQRWLDDFLAHRAESPEGAEAYYLRGILQHRAGDDDAAIETWKRGIAQHPPTESLFGQKMHLTHIRQNFELAGVVATQIH